MRQVIAALGTAALIVTLAPAIQANPLGPAVRSLTDDEVVYTRKGGWHGGRKPWKHAWKRRGPPPWAPAWGLRHKRGR